MAAGLAAELKQALGLDSELTEGKGGIFLVKLDGKTFYDKHETGRFPALGEISKAIREQHPEL
jgi:predicted Rdx family selenoprotein